MKRNITVLLNLVLIFCFTLVSLSAVKATAAKKRKQITGIVTEINTEDNTITVKKKDKVITLNVGEKTGIIQCTEKVTFTKIGIGDKITIKYLKDNDKNVARRIIIKEKLRKLD